MLIGREGRGKDAWERLSAAAASRSKILLAQRNRDRVSFGVNKVRKRYWLRLYLEPMKGDR
ncbi:MAG: hypothetical protein ACLFVT_06745 [Syntrophobacteria bacterium]